MNQSLRVSILLNVFLGASLLVLLCQRQEAEQGAVVARETGSPRDTAAEKAVSAAAELKAKAPSFCWSQIESSDYRAYVRNLRGIGCPERTVRDIIHADIDGLYTTRRQDLHLPEAGSGAWSLSEQAWLVATLLGEQAVVAADASALGKSMEDDVATATDTVPHLPLALREVNWALLELEPDQVAAIEELREQFLARIGGADQDPTDPNYLERWLRAQPEIDEALPGLIGREAYLRFESAADANP